MVLATAQIVDFIYVCENHLSDPGFASPIGESSGAGNAKVGLSPEEIAKVKEDWEMKQKRKAEKTKEKEKEKKEGAGEKDKDKETEQKKNGKDPVPVTLPSTPTTPTPTHKRYALHRDIFAMRISEHRKRRQAAQAKELAPRLPGAPRSSVLP